MIMYGYFRAKLILNYQKSLKLVDSATMASLPSCQCNKSVILYKVCLAIGLFSLLLYEISHYGKKEELI